MWNLGGHLNLCSWAMAIQTGSRINYSFFPLRWELWRLHQHSPSLFSLWDFSYAIICVWWCPESLWCLFNFHYPVFFPRLDNLNWAIPFMDFFFYIPASQIFCWAPVVSFLIQFLYFATSGFILLCNFYHLLISFLGGASLSHFIRHGFLCGMEALRDSLWLHGPGGPVACCVEEPGLEFVAILLLPPKCLGLAVWATTPGS